ncbi:MAG: hypothetical protein WA672_06670 [Candidatus Angelobacter sp.]
MPKLEIHDAKKEEVYRDIIRIPEDDRRDTHGKVIDEGRICCIIVGEKSALLIVRGVASAEFSGHVHGGCIHMDDVTRKRLSLEESRIKQAEFKITPVGIFGEFRWAWSATEIGYRISSRLALLGLVLGLIALALALPEAFNWICSSIK